MGIPVPSNDELGAIAASFGLSPSEDDLAAYRELVVGALADYDAVEDLYQRQAPAVPDRHSWQPEPADNPLGAWYRRCAVRERDEGLLAGKRIAIKDNVDVAGVPMMNGSATLEGFVPRSDASVVRRILEAGGEIAGKAVCEDLCFSGGSHTAATGPVRNPWDPARSAGGSSCGSAVLVATGEVDMAIAGDQGGSVRMPAGWSGVVGIKATFGLVPYTGAFPIEYTIDNLGPIARTVDDTALLLTAIAGPDGVDHRQAGAPSDVDYTTGLDRDPVDLRIGVVAEGFGHPNSEGEVDETVRAALGRLEAAGAEVRRISVPEHLWATAVWSVIATEGAAWQM
ncbi:MAG: amidase family protein, partial [bacterium]|nr:amidase family protein [bacterium]